MQKWEYMVTDLKGKDDEESEVIMNKHGRHGWELVAVQIPYAEGQKDAEGVFMFLKRAIEGE